MTMEVDAGACRDIVEREEKRRRKGGSARERRREGRAFTFSARFFEKTAKKCVSATRLEIANEEKNSFRQRKKKDS